MAFQGQDLGLQDCGLSTILNSAIVDSAILGNVTATILAAKLASSIRRLACSSSTKANRVQFPAESPDSRKWESCMTMPLVGGFFRASPVSPSPSSQRHPTLYISNISIQFFGNYIDDIYGYHTCGANCGAWGANCDACAAECGACGANFLCAMLTAVSVVPIVACVVLTMVHVVLTVVHVVLTVGCGGDCDALLILVCVVLIGVHEDVIALAKNQHRVMVKVQNKVKDIPVQIAAKKTDRTEIVEGRLRFHALDHVYQFGIVFAYKTYIIITALPSKTITLNMMKRAFGAIHFARPVYRMCVPSPINWSQQYATVIPARLVGVQYGEMTILLPAAIRYNLSRTHQTIRNFMFFLLREECCWSFEVVWQNHAIAAETNFCLRPYKGSVADDGSLELGQPPKRLVGLGERGSGWSDETLEVCLLDDEIYSVLGLMFRPREALKCSRPLNGRDCLGSPDTPSAEHSVVNNPQKFPLGPYHRDVLVLEVVDPVCSGRFGEFPLSMTYLAVSRHAALAAYWKGTRGGTQQFWFNLYSESLQQLRYQCLAKILQEIDGMLYFPFSKNNKVVLPEKCVNFMDLQDKTVEGKRSCVSTGDTTQADLIDSIPYTHANKGIKCLRLQSIATANMC
ncbi:hypothetical protein PR048_012986 [Dryococelus australis]|uniref:Uncharacterized protein n=1 Tax=Dryococelus australis TaxID=614101 RepID=A0ABQ9HQY0_9NEOP|nr:hypothetical protein PR048_012986 [Dryococelus australis]